MRLLTSAATSRRRLIIHVRLLGTAAGGGLPQWNCACVNCQEARAAIIPARSQSSVAIGDGEERWFLVNASPDLRAQIEAFSDLQPSPRLTGGETGRRGDAETGRGEGGETRRRGDAETGRGEGWAGASPYPDNPRSLRNSPIAGVLLTNPDLDHVLGLFALREGSPLNIYASDAVRQTLTRYIGLQGILQAFCGVNWHKLPQSGFAPLPDAGGRASGKQSRDGSATLPDSDGRGSGKQSRDGSATVPQASGRASVSQVERGKRLRCLARGGGLSYRIIVLPGSPPPFAKINSPASAQSVAYQFVDTRTGGRLLVAPDVAQITEPLRQAVQESDAVLFDGTFWSARELARVKPGAVSARKMGHVPIQQGSLNLLAKSGARHKIYIHINNTNPILACQSPQRSQVEAAGIMIGYDGYEFEV